MSQIRKIMAEVFERATSIATSFYHMLDMFVVNKREKICINPKRERGANLILMKNIRGEWLPGAYLFCWGRGQKIRLAPEKTPLLPMNLELSLYFL